MDDRRAIEKNSLDAEKTVLRIKVEIPTRKLRAVDIMHKIFKAVIEMNTDIVLIGVSNTELVDDHFEFVAEVAPFKSPCADLFFIVQTYLYKIKFYHVQMQNPSLQFRRDMMPTIFVSSPFFFDDACIPWHKNVPVQSLYFGNIINSGALAVHWTVEYGDRAEGLETDKMTATFEYDRSTIAIRFVNIERNRARQRTNEVEYTVKIYLQALRRIIVDPLSQLYAQNKKRYRIHFEMNCPAEVRSFIPMPNNKKDLDKRFGDGNRCTVINRGMGSSEDKRVYNDQSAITDSPVLTLEFPPGDPNIELFFEIISRLRRRSGIPTEFGCLDLIEMHIDRNCPYVKDPCTGPAFLKRIANAIKVDKWQTRPDKPAYYPERFGLQYMIEALLSRGAKTKDQLIVNPENWTIFIDFICREYKRRPDELKEALEKLLDRVDEMKQKTNIVRHLIESLKQVRKAKSIAMYYLSDNMKDEGYVKVRKVVVTPTRVIYIAPERLMGNRVLRNYNSDLTRVVRVQFRDEDSNPMRSNTTGAKMTENCVENALKDGIVLGGRTYRYLGSSNSQMRDNGAYFYFDPNPTYDKNGKWHPSKRVQTVRRNLGKFDDLKSVPKFMARMGQCFTQSRRVATGLSDGLFAFIFDVVGGSDVGDEGEPYQYSDGVGQISLEFMAKISEDMKMQNKCIPSCIQFRYRGYKGVMTLHPLLDDRNRLNTYLCSGEKRMNCLFRPSQCKFEAPIDPDFEVVKYSAPTPVCLNKPFINILDQVSEMQSHETHQRLCSRVGELLDRQLRGMAETLVKEKACRDKLKELPRRVAVDILKREFGFCLTTEPFFRSMLKAAVRYMIRKQLNKEQIQIPLELGRSMFGVVDETGRLQYGQIFVQYHNHINEKMPKPTAKKTILTGRVLITKNPSIVAGDVRMFEAVDIPELHHLVDVVVFPQHGPRSHPDEMAGSDLDGDEYSVIWDHLLYFDYNEKAMQFPKAPPTTLIIKEKELDAQMRKFYIDYVTQDSVGMIANAHLVNSDLWGLNSKVCEQIALKSSQAVDFPKTGKPPDPLTKEWDIPKDKEDKRLPIPPERPHRKPDFMQKWRDTCYASVRLIGRIFRDINQLDEVLSLSEERDQQLELTVDEKIDIEGWQDEYEDAMKEEMYMYNNDMKALMENYGIVNEGELMSGCMLSVRNSLSDRESDDMSFFNTNLVIETQVTAIFRRYRERFFEEFGDVKGYTQQCRDMRGHEDDNVMHRAVLTGGNASLKMRQKAVAMYRITYTMASEQKDSSPRLLSFAWIAYDVLAIIKEEKAMADKNFIAGLNPVDTLVTEHLKKFIAFNRMEFVEDVKKWTGRDNEGLGVEAVMRYLDYYEDLAEVAFFFVEWARKENLLQTRFSEVHIILLLIQFCLGHYGSDEMIFSKVAMGAKPMGTRLGISNPGLLIHNFFRWMGCRPFKQMKYISLGEPDLGYDCVFMRGEWVPIGNAAMKSFYELVFSLRVDVPIGDELIVDPPPIIREMQPFVIELPVTTNDFQVAAKIRELTGASEVQLRRMETADKTRVNVCASGPLASHSKIRNLLIVPISIKSTDNAKEMSDSIPDLILAKINSGGEDPRR